MSDTIQITEPEQSKKFSIFSYGFRPFFLAAGIYAIVPLIPWLLYLNGFIDPDIPLQTWHAHEMFFGFVSAAISGFLLTAIPNWTNTPPASGTKLKFLFSLWLAGRVAFWLFLFFDHPIFGYLLFIDLLLPIVQGTRIARIFIKAGTKKHFIFVGMMVMLGIANLLVILELNNLTSDTAMIGAMLAPNIVLIMIGVIGGRVVPNFTRGHLKQKGIEIKSFFALEIAAIGLLLANMITDLIVPHSTFSGIIVLIAFAVHLLRFSLWKTRHVLDKPILLVLHLGYIWLLATLFLKGSEIFLDLPYHLYLHAFTIGTVGTFILGIMTRAALGHTGRKLELKPIILFAYLCITAAGLARVTAPFFTDFYVNFMSITTLLWVLAFSIFLWVYAPILTRPRVDGKAG